MRKKVLLPLSLLLGGLFIFAANSLLIAIRSTPTKPFDSTTWKQIRREWMGHAYSPTNIERAQMVGDLLAHHVRLGMTRKSVLALLTSGDTVEGGTDYEIDYYRLVNCPCRFRLWQSRLWWSTAKDDPTLYLEYHGPNRRLTSISFN